MSFLGTMPLGQGQPVKQHAGLIGRFAVPFAATSFLMFALAGAAGLWAARAIPAGVRLVLTVVLLGAALALDTYSLRRKTWCPITLRRQTPQGILYEHGMRRAALAWGLDTGLMFTTYRTTSIVWALLALGLLGVTPWWAGIGYSVGFLVPLALGLVLKPVPTGSSEGPAVATAFARHRGVGRLTSTAALAIAVTIAAGAVVTNALSAN